MVSRIDLRSGAKDQGIAFCLAQAEGAPCVIASKSKTSSNPAMRARISASIISGLRKVRTATTSRVRSILFPLGATCIDTAAKALDIPYERFIINLEQYGNTSAGTIPIALDEANRDGRIKEGDIIALSGFGAGLTWGGAIVRW